MSVASLVGDFEYLSCCDSDLDARLADFDDLALADLSDGEIIDGTFPC